jgi:dipeptidyl aminopeptidase/acylaminoacyl peptidase
MTRTPLAGYALNTYVIPHWIPGRDAFWYRRQTAKGAEFVLVNAETGTKSTAFPHSAMAKELTRVLGEPITPDALPMQTLDFAAADSSVSFRVKATSIRCRLEPAVACEKAPSEGAGPDVSVSPDKTKAVFVRLGNLWLRDLKTGHESVLTSDGSPDNGYGIGLDLGDQRHLVRLRSGAPSPPLGVHWSPDSQRLIIRHVDQSAVTPYPYLEYAPFDGSFRPKLQSVRLPLAGEPEPRVTWVAFDIRAGTHRPIDLPYSDLEMATPSAIETDPDRWSADSRDFFGFLPSHNEHSVHLFDIDAAKGAARDLIHEEAYPPAVFHAGGYETPSVAILGGGREILWFSQRDGLGQIYLYDGQTGALKNQVTKGDFVVRDIVKIDETRRKLYFVVSGVEANPYWRDLYEVNFDGSGQRRLSPETGDKLITNPITPFSFNGAIGYESISPDARFALYTVSPIDKPPELVLRRVADGALVSVVETADISALLAAGYRPPEEFTTKAADGTSDIYGVIYRPTNYDPRRKYPVIDSNYASPTTPITPHNFTAALTQIDISPAPTWTALGFVVIVVDGRGTPFRGKAFSSPVLGFTATMGLEDHVAAIRALAARDKGLDLERVGIAGMSYGGWTSVRALINYPDFYKVALAGAPPGSWYSMIPAVGLVDAYDGPPVYADGGHLRPTPTAKPVNWSASDSIAQIGKIKGKLLLLMGGVDENVLPGSTMQLLQAAEDADRNIDLVFNPRGNHAGFYGQYATRKSWDFFVRNLMGETPPSDFQLGHDP